MVGRSLFDINNEGLKGKIVSFEPDMVDINSVTVNFTSTLKAARVTKEFAQGL